MKKIFIEAHKMTREMVKKYKVDYQAQFGLNLSYLLEEEKEEEVTLESIEDIKTLIKTNMDNVKTERNFDIVTFEFNNWENYGKHRVYFNISINTKGNTARRADGYIDVDTMKIFSTRKESRRYNEDTIDEIYQTIRRNMEEIINVVA